MNDSATVSVGATMLTTGLIAGTMDALAASCQFFLRTGKSPAGVWRYVASAVVRADAAVGPDARVALGIALHFVIALAWTALFFLAASRFRVVRGNPWIIGPLYGLLVWVLMNRVLVPLTLIGPPKAFNAMQAAIGALIIVVCIGIPIALGAHRVYR